MSLLPRYPLNNVGTISLYRWNQQISIKTTNILYHSIDGINKSPSRPPIYYITLSMESTNLHQDHQYTISLYRWNQQFSIKTTNILYHSIDGINKSPSRPPIYYITLSMESTNLHQDHQYTISLYRWNQQISIKTTNILYHSIDGINNSPSRPPIYYITLSMESTNLHQDHQYTISLYRWNQQFSIKTTNILYHSIDGINNSPSRPPIYYITLSMESTILHQDHQYTISLYRWNQQISIKTTNILYHSIDGINKSPSRPPIYYITLSMESTNLHQDHQYTISLY